MVSASKYFNLEEKAMSKKKKKKQTDDIIIKTVNGIKVTIPEDLKDWRTFARRPYYQMRGKTVTPEQAFEIIRRTDTYFTWFCNLGMKPCDCLNDDRLGSINFNMWWFDTNHYPLNYGWCHPDGTIGHNGITQKYPELDELIDECTMWANEFNFLDLVILITTGEELTPWQYDKLKESWKIIDLKKRVEFDKTWQLQTPPDLFDCADIGVWVHDGEVEFLERTSAIKKYKEYVEKYEDKEEAIYSSDYYEHTKKGLIPVEYFERCLDGYGVMEDRKKELVDKFNEARKRENIE